MFARTLIEAILILGVITQIGFPLINGTPVFPLFRRRKQEFILHQMEHARQDLVEDSLEQQLHDLRRKHAAYQKTLEEIDKDADEHVRAGSGRESSTSTETVPVDRRDSGDPDSNLDHREDGV